MNDRQLADLFSRNGFRTPKDQIKAAKIGMALMEAFDAAGFGAAQGIGFCEAMATMIENVESVVSSMASAVDSLN